MKRSPNTKRPVTYRMNSVATTVLLRTMAATSPKDAGACAGWELMSEAAYGADGPF